jgi:hypothetical protein
VTLAGANSLIYSTPNNGQTLENVNNLIQGQGQIGAGYNMVVKNDIGGTILANVSGQTLTINANGGLTNSGTLQVAAGSTMVVSSPLANFGANTLTGGTYISAGNMELGSVVNGTNGIYTNGATIILSGAGKITDSTGAASALSNFQDNLSTGSFTVENGQVFTTAANGTDFTNAGAVDVGADSRFTTSTNYTQTGGTTQVDGTLAALGGQIDIIGGTLSGLGRAIATTVTIGADGTLSPGDPGDFNIVGSLVLPGTYDEEIAGTHDGSFDEVLVTGTGNIAGGTLDISLINGFTLGANGSDSFVILDASGGLDGTEFANVDFLNRPAGDTYRLDYSNPDEVILDLNGPVTVTATPEPGFYVLLTIGIAGMIGVKIRNRRQGAQ